MTFRCHSPYPTFHSRNRRRATNCFVVRNPSGQKEKQGPGEQRKQDINLSPIRDWHLDKTMKVQALNQAQTLDGFSFYLSVSNQMPELVSVDGKMRVPLASLDASGLVRAKNLAHNQYVQAMMHESDDLDVHRATLNFLCKAIERSGISPSRPKSNKSRPAPARKMTSKIERRISRKMAV